MKFSNTNLLPFLFSNELTFIDVDAFNGLMTIEKIYLKYAKRLLIVKDF